jgi:hypothetical protein
MGDHQFYQTLTPVLPAIEVPNENALPNTTEVP